MAEKELRSLTQKETKLKVAVQKATKQLNATEAKLKAASKSKQAKSGKKQLAAAKKLLAEATLIHRSLNKELQEVSTLVAKCAEKHAKYLALRKFLAQFDKEWSKQVKSVKVKAKTKRKSAKRKTSSAASSNMEQSNVENFNSSVDNVTMTEEAEVA